MFHILARDYGWTIDEISSLSLTQIDCLFEGRRLIEEDKKRSPQDAKGADTINDVRQLFAMPGVKLSKAAKEKITNAKKE